MRSVTSPPRLPGNANQMPSDPDEHGWRSLTKAGARRRLRELVSAIPEAQAARSSSLVCQRVAETATFRSAGSVMVFASLRSSPGPGPAAATSVEREVDLSELAIAALRRGMRVCLPRVDWVNRTLAPAWIAAWPGDLVEGRFGIAEPVGRQPLAPIDQIDLVLAPGLGFDRAGNRLGRGGGFYDRFLALPGRQGSVCGVCFSQQLLPPGAGLPIDPWDRPVDLVVTNLEIVTP